MQINVTPELQSDPRLRFAAATLGQHHHRVLGSLVYVLDGAFTRRTAILPAKWIDGIAELPGFADALVEAEFATWEGELVRLCDDLVADRLAWLSEQDSKRGKANAARRRKRDDSGSPGESPGGTSQSTVPGLPEVPPGSPPGNSQWESPGDVPLSVGVDLSVGVGREREAPARPEPGSRKPAALAHDLGVRQTALATRVWFDHCDRHEALRGELASSVRPLRRIEQAQGWRDLRERIRPYTDLAAAEADCRHVLAVRESEARVKRKLEWFGDMVWREDQFSRALSHENRASVARVVVDNSIPSEMTFNGVVVRFGEGLAKRTKRLLDAGTPEPETDKTNLAIAAGEAKP